LIHLLFACRQPFFFVRNFHSIFFYYLLFIIFYHILLNSIQKTIHFISRINLRTFQFFNMVLNWLIITNKNQSKSNTNSKCHSFLCLYWFEKLSEIRLWGWIHFFFRTESVVILRWLLRNSFFSNSLNRKFSIFKIPKLVPGLFDNCYYVVESNKSIL
jgi:hypothetical protein